MDISFTSDMQGLMWMHFVHIYAYSIIHKHFSIIQIHFIWKSFVSNFFDVIFAFLWEF